MRLRSTGVIVPIATGLTLACGGNDAPTPVATVPIISGIQPASLAATNLTQRVTFAGTGFDSEPTLTLTDPNGANVQFTGDQVASKTAVSIAIDAVLGSAGIWRSQVKNAAGQTSSMFAFNVGPAVPPAISSISPNHVDANSSTTVTVNGSGFQRGLSLLFT